MSLLPREPFPPPSEEAPLVSPEPVAITNEAAPTESTGSRFRSSAFELLKTLVLVLVLVVTIRAFVVEAYVINGKSMEPTFHDSERLLISKFAPRFEELERGDIVIFQHGDDEKRLIKRVIGLPGDEVEIRGGFVHVNGKRLDEPYLEDSDRDPTSNYGPRIVPPDHYFVLGDNRPTSNDSRREAVGFIGREQIIGKALILFYPPSKIRIF